MSIPYEELCRGCFDTHKLFEERIESCTGVIAAARDGKDLERAYFSRGLNREAIGDFVGALEDYDQAIALTPMSRYFECRGNMYSATGTMKLLYATLLACSSSTSRVHGTLLYRPHPRGTRRLCARRTVFHAGS